MRIALLMFVAACWRQEAAAPRREAVPNDTVITSEPVPAHAAVPRRCPLYQNAALGGIQLSASNHTTTNINLCARMDAALSKVNALASYQGRGYEVVVDLSRITVTGDHIACQLSVAIKAPPSNVGLVNGGAKVQTAPSVALAIDDCVSAVLEDVFAKKIFP